MKLACNANVDALEQLETIIRSVTPTDYSTPVKMGAYNIGRHVRHITDHYLALKKGVSKGLVDYDLRNRDSDVETNSHNALQLIDVIKDWLVNDLYSDQVVSIKTEVTLYETNSLTISSTLQRELIYLVNHTVHHVAYMALLAQQLGAHLDSNIGLAPCTASYMRSTHAT